MDEERARCSGDGEGKEQEGAMEGVERLVVERFETAREML